MENWFLKELCDRNRSMMSLDKGLHLYYLLQKALDTEGDVVEFGCYRGITGVLLAKSCNRSVHLYDSFQGLPDKGEKDAVSDGSSMRRCDFLDNKRVGKGWFAATEEEVLETFAHYKVVPPIIHKGWFEEIEDGDLPKKIAFAHIDGDFYTSTISALRLVYPRMPDGGIIVIDDYCDPAIHGRQSQFPGVKRACDHFFADKPERVEVLATGGEYQAYVTRGSDSKRRRGERAP